jgi:hypothetical protein
MIHGDPHSLRSASELHGSDSPHTAVLPRGCTFTESDWRALAPFWYPVAFSKK